MNQKKILALAVAATFMVPMTTYADVKLSGTIQAEMGWATLGQVNGEEVDTVRVSKDGSGALLNGGPNRLRFDVDEKLGGGLTAYGRYQVSFDTAVNTGLVKGQETWVGLKTSSFLLRFGKLEGNYRSSKGLVDPFAGTAIQARATAGGMSGDKYLGLVGTAGGETLDAEDWLGAGYYIDQGKDGKYRVWAPWVDNDPRTQEDERTVVEGVNAVNLKTNAGALTYDNGLAHSGYVNNALELGLKFGGFSASFQGIFDETDQLDGAGLIELRYSAPEDVFTLFAAASYLDFGDFSNTLKNTTKSSDKKKQDENAKNWKIGGQFKMAGVTLGLQYEDAEIGSFDPNPEGGKYVLGSLDYKINNVAIGGWVAGYMSDAEDTYKWRINGELINEDAINWAVGVKYFFSKRTMAYLGYLQTDSDNDYRDQKAYGLGLRHDF